MVCRTSGGHWWAAALLTRSLGFLLIIYRDLTHLHIWTMCRRKCMDKSTHWRWEYMRTNKALNYKYITHLHEVTNTTNPCFSSIWVLLNEAKSKSCCFIMTFLTAIHPLTSSSPWFSVAQTLLSCPLSFFMVWHTDNNAINQKLWGCYFLWQKKKLSHLKSL